MFFKDVIDEVNLEVLNWKIMYYSGIQSLPFEVHLLTTIFKANIFLLHAQKDPSFLHIYLKINKIFLSWRDCTVHNV